MENLLIDNTLEEKREGFSITDLESASWAFRKLRAINKKEKEINDCFNKELELLKSWKEKEIKSFEDEKAYFEGLITAYYSRQKKEDTRFKLSTPYGKVTSRNEDKWFYDDEEGLISYLKDNGIDAVKSEETLNKKTLKSICKNGVNPETGEILPFVRVEKTQSISIKVEE